MNIKPPKKKILNINDKRYQKDTLRLQKVIRYYDDFSDKVRTINTDAETWLATIDGKKVRVTWSCFKVFDQDVLKKFLAWAFSKYDPSSVIVFFKAIQYHSETVSIWLDHFSDPNSARAVWEAFGYSNLRSDVIRILRPLITFLCEMS